MCISNGLSKISTSLFASLETKSIWITWSMQPNLQKQHIIKGVILTGFYEMFYHIRIWKKYVYTLKLWPAYAWAYHRLKIATT